MGKVHRTQEVNRHVTRGHYGPSMLYGRPLRAQHDSAETRYTELDLSNFWVYGGQGTRCAWTLEDPEPAGLSAPRSLSGSIGATSCSDQFEEQSQCKHSLSAEHSAAATNSCWEYPSKVGYFTVPRGPVDLGRVPKHR